MRFYGCAGCHEIAGLEEEQRIGTELTKEGSKPIERLDFALLGHEAEAEGWLHAQRLLRAQAGQSRGLRPRQGEGQAGPAEDAEFQFVEAGDRCASPRFSMARWMPACRRAISTRRATSARTSSTAGGWSANTTAWAATSVHVGQTTIFDTLPRYQDPDWKDQKPPTLIGEGARVNPEWLMRFLEQSVAQRHQDTNRDGVRQYLHARMPTFYFSDGEIHKLVRFFAAMSSQAEPFIAEQAGTADRSGAHHGAAVVHERRRALPEVPHAPATRSTTRKPPRPISPLAKERLQPGWARRWMLDPAMMSPGTAMPSRLVHARGRPLGFCRSHAAGFQRL